MDGTGLEEGLGRGRGRQECLTLFFTDWLLSSPSMSRSKLNTCRLRTPRTPWQRQRTVPQEPAPGGHPRVPLPLLAPLRRP